MIFVTLLIQLIVIHFDLSPAISVTPIWPTVWSNKWMFQDVQTGKLLDFGEMTYDATLNKSWLHNSICPQPLDGFGPFLNVSCDTIFDNNGMVWRIIPNINQPQQCCIVSNNTNITPTNWLVNNCFKQPKIVYLWGMDLYYWNCTTDPTFIFEYWSIKSNNLPFQNNFGGAYWITPWVTINNVNESTFNVPQICNNAPNCPPNTSYTGFEKYGSLFPFIRINNDYNMYGA